ncbi:CBS domain-containing protein [Streptomyces sp. SLBN-115]|uniref:CBS domain-containing protein n=1 Tax=Streptomyces sp. SLBN-115 TaxID=2768453 RepID=UPI00190F121F|nr:CBS domain-containing protein [Streptomyces sp. SLBN-115]
MEQQPGAAHGLGLVVFMRGGGQVPLEKSGAVTVDEVMVPLSRTIVAGPHDSLADLLPRMEPGAEHRVLVMDEGTLVGILSLSDISRTVTWLMNTAPRRS